MEPSPVPSEDCGMCKNFTYFGFTKCQCSCHRVGNYIQGYHEHFNFIPYDLPEIPPKKGHKTKFG